MTDQKKARESVVEASIAHVAAVLAQSIETRADQHEAREDQTYATFEALTTALAALDGVTRPVQVGERLPSGVLLTQEIADAEEAFLAQPVREPQSVEAATALPRTVEVGPFTFTLRQFQSSDGHDWLFRRDPSDGHQVANALVNALVNEIVRAREAAVRADAAPVDETEFVDFAHEVKSLLERPDLAERGSMQTDAYTWAVRLAAPVPPVEVDMERVLRESVRVTACTKYIHPDAGSSPNMMRIGAPCANCGRMGIDHHGVPPVESEMKQ